MEKIIKDPTTGENIIIHVAGSGSGSKSNHDIVEFTKLQVTSNPRGIPPLLSKFVTEKHVNYIKPLIPYKSKYESFSEGMTFGIYQKDVKSAVKLFLADIEQAKKDIRNDTNMRNQCTKMK